MGCEASIIILSLIAIYSFKWDRGSIFRWFSIWCIVIFVDYYLFRDYFVPFAKEFDLFFAGFILIFFGSYKLFCYFFEKKKKWRLKIRVHIKYQYYYAIAVIAAIFSIILFARAFLSYSFSQLRELLGHSQISLHVGISFPLVAALVYYNNLHGVKKRSILPKILLMILAFISTSKMWIIMAIMYSIPWYKRGFKFDYKQFLPYILFAAATLYVFHISTGRLGGGSNLIEKIQNTFNGYLVGGLAIFQKHFSGANVRGWQVAGRWYGNVATMFAVFYAERNYYIFAARTIVLGILYAALRREGNEDFFKIYSFYPLYFIFFSDLFIQGAVQWIAFFICGFATKVIRLPQPSKNKSQDFLVRRERKPRQIQVTENPLIMQVRASSEYEPRH